MIQTWVTWVYMETIQVRVTLFDENKHRVCLTQRAEYQIDIETIDVRQTTEHAPFSWLDLI